LSTIARRAGATVLTIGMLAGLAACGSDQSVPDADHPVTRVTATPSASAVVATPDRVEPPTVEPLTVTGEAASVFGEDKVQQGYREMTEYAAAYTFQPRLMQKTHDQEVADFADLASRMLPETAEEFLATATRAVADDPDEKDNGAVATLAFAGFTGPDVTWPTSGPLVTEHRITNPKVAVDTSNGQPRLEVTLDQSAIVNLLQSGKPLPAVCTKTVSFWLVPAEAGSEYAWQIGAYRGTYHVDATGGGA